MDEYYYSKKDRIEQLENLITALDALLSHMKNNHIFINMIDQYEHARNDAQLLLDCGFNQKQLCALNEAVPDLFNRHRDWRPPMEDENDIYSKPAKWYINLDEHLQKARDAAALLSEVGYY